ncbi:MAG: hypothetical protein GY832_42720 [Chloroflexi bacterium]|nr:hypothetical protein [Chloroflexota bacterium]
MKITVLTDEQTQALKAPFPPEALSKDTSRGFELTSIKAAFVIERLNDVFGLCGTGWCYVHSPFQEILTNGKTEVVTEVGMQYRFESTDNCAGSSGKLVWNIQTNDWAFLTEDTNLVWSEPIFACGGKQVVKSRVTDARKSAVTDGVTKAASMIGVGHNVFKGQVRVGGNNSHKQQSKQHNTSHGSQTHTLDDLKKLIAKARLDEAKVFAHLKEKFGTYSSANIPRYVLEVKAMPPGNGNDGSDPQAESVHAEMPTGNGGEPQAAPVEVAPAESTPSKFETVDDAKTAILELAIKHGAMKDITDKKGRAALVLDGTLAGLDSDNALTEYDQWAKLIESKYPLGGNGKEPVVEGAGPPAQQKLI